MTLTLNTHIPSLTQLVVCIYQLSVHRLQKFLKNPSFQLFPIETKALVAKFDLAAPFEQNMMALITQAVSEKKF